MTKKQRVGTFFFGIIQILAAVLFFLDPKGGLRIAISLLGFSMTIRGLQGILYYLSMARHMVGGKIVLYRGLIYLDLGLFTSSLAAHQRIYLMMYLAGINAFAALVNILRSLEDKRVGAATWKYQAMTAGASALAAVAVVVGGVFMRSVTLVVYIYAIGVLYKGCFRIASVFRRTEILFIQ